MFSDAEQRLLDALRDDARVRCAPRRTELPINAVAGVECQVNTPLVDRVGVYGFDGLVFDSDGRETDPALLAYLTRLADYGIEPLFGDCEGGVRGDRSWPHSLPDRADDGGEGHRSTRSGCFLDENGAANIRLTCYDSIYVGILGKGTDLAALYRWAWRQAEGESSRRDAPGICSAAG